MIKIQFKPPQCLKFHRSFPLLCPLLWYFIIWILFSWTIPCTHLPEDQFSESQFLSPLAPVSPSQSQLSQEVLSLCSTNIYHCPGPPCGPHRLSPTCASCYSPGRGRLSHQPCHSQHWGRSWLCPCSTVCDSWREEPGWCGECPQQWQIYPGRQQRECEVQCCSLDLMKQVRF